MWINGQPIGENTGAYIPFELARRAASSARGTNRLVVRVDSRRLDRDFPPARLNTDGVPTGGWWNYSGIQREVYLRKLDTVDFQRVQVRPVIACGTCAASVRVQVNLRNVTRAAASGSRSRASSATRTCGLGTKGSARTGSRQFTDTIRIEQPAAVVAAGSPNLYDVSFTVRVGGRKVAGYELHSGIRSIKVSNGRLVLNGQFAQPARRRPARGVQGRGLRDRQRAPRAARQRGQGARRDVLRTHYPLHPYTHELADRLGLLIWSEIPVYSVSTEVLKEPARCAGSRSRS